MTERPGLYQRYRRLSLGVRILIFMALGVLAGAVIGERAAVVQPIGDLFIRLLMMVAIPLIFFNLVAGMSSLSDLATLGRLGGKIMMFFLLTGVAALLIGLGAMHLLRPGDGLRLRSDVAPEVSEVPSVTDLLLDLVPANIFAAFTQGNVSQIVVFAVFLGITSLLMPTPVRAKLQASAETVSALLRKMVEVVMYFGPIGIGALAAAAVGQFGVQVFGPLSLFIIGVTLGHAAVVAMYMLLIRLLTPNSPLWFVRTTAPLYATAAATCSSLASLVVAFQMAEERLRIPRSIYAFTLPLGAQINKDGTCVMLTAVLLFTAQGAGVPFEASMIPSALLLGLLLSAGSGGIPGGGLVMALIYVQAFGLPLEIAALVGGIYRLIDMGNTTLNVGGDLVGTLIVAHSERAIPAVGGEPRIGHDGGLLD